MRNSVSNSVFGSRARSKYLRTFYITIFLISLYTAFSIVADQSARYIQGDSYGVVQRRTLAELDAARLLKKDEECRLVRHAEDKCAFIKANCPDEEAGLLTYLSLYYCRLPGAQPVAFVILVLWLALLFSTIGIAASDFFCINLGTIASVLGMSESLTGVTFLALGNGSPDVFSTFAAMSTHSGSLAVGELFGAAGFITAVVAGSMALVREFKVGRKTFVRDVSFFIVAASFSMVFLADGKLQFWECCIMIGFYLFYVATVVTWHWYLQRRRKWRERSSLARAQYIAPGNIEIEVQEEGADDEDAPAGERQSLIQTGRTEDFSALERGGSPAFGRENYPDNESDGDDEQGRLLAAEMSNSMRVTGHRGSRRSTINPIRPSLVGALEFRSILSTLQRSKSLQSRSIYLRRYSDDLTALLNPYAGPASETAVTSDYSGSIPFTGTENPEDINQLDSSAPKTRAVSMNDAGGPKYLDPAAFSVPNIPEIGIVAATPTFSELLTIPAPALESGPGPLPREYVADHPGAAPRSPTISLTPPPTNAGSRDVSPETQNRRHRFDNRLAAPDDGFPGARHLRNASRLSDSAAYPLDTRSFHQPQLIIPNSRDSSRGRPSPVLSGFPTYTDSPLPISAQGSKPSTLPPPETHLSLESSYILDGLNGTTPRRIKWWPYRILPRPEILFSTLFPTLCMWEDKSVWDKILSVISVPSIFLLTVTLPVVELESKDEDSGKDDILYERTLPRLISDSPNLGPQTEPEWLHYRRSTLESQLPKISAPALHGLSGNHNTPERTISTEIPNHNPHTEPTIYQIVDNLPDIQDGTSKGDWNRWLVALQIFTAPLFVVLLICANGLDDEPNLKQLVRLVLYSLLGSSIAVSILLLTTTAERSPKYRFLFCFVGFVVSVSWISTIANEVVGVLKAFGVILGISDAILGLTIFAVGNSLGDLVADITVARLGFPFMALSACFGGPMLNILLGIGVSGLYLTIIEGQDKQSKHPDRPMKYKPYQIDVSVTLLVSGITLLVTLASLLIAVPLNKWVMSRRIGWGLIALWSLSTAINVILEITGLCGDTTVIF